MNSNMLKTVSFLAAMVVGSGAFAFAGCTVTSGNPDDGQGQNRPDSGSSTSSSSTSSTSSSSSGGTDSSTPVACEGNAQTATIVNATCQACLNAKCCTELKTCFNMPKNSGGANCDEYAKCIDDCFSDKYPTDADKQKCATDFCIAAAPEFQQPYEAIIDCAERNNNCVTECQ